MLLNPAPDTANMCPVTFSELREVTITEVNQLILHTSKKSCDLDLLPAFALNLCLNKLLPIITKRVNVSLQSGSVPDSLKIALLSQLLKKINMSYEEYCNLRPISNLTTVSKEIEKAAAVQLIQYLTKNNLLEKFQSAYKSSHSTLLEVQTNILQALDTGNSTTLVLLDLSAAFDTVNHSKLLLRLFHRFGIRGRALKWFESYLSHRKQFVRIDGCDSTMRDLERGVPQGSVLGPLLYSLYTAPLADIAKHQNVRCHFFVDDIQLYVHLKK